MSDFDIWQHSKVKAEVHRAEWEHHAAARDAELQRSRVYELLSQHEPLASAGIDRETVRPILRYIIHGDKYRMEREMKGDKS